VDELQIGSIPDSLFLTIEVKDYGPMKLSLFSQDAPRNVLNVANLAIRGFYNGLTFHRLIPGFMIQGGDPSGNGTGGTGYTVPAEIKRLHTKGAMAMARTGDQVNPERRSSGSQFYICFRPTPQLDGQYTVIGQVVEGMDVLERLEGVPTGALDRPRVQIVMERVYVTTSETGSVQAHAAEEQLGSGISKAVVPPALNVAATAEDANGNQVFDGGERVGLTVRVANSGAGQAKGVSVKLGGASRALAHLGTSQSIGDVGPGETKEAKFEATLPNRIEADNGNIVIRVTEANGFDALEEKELIVAMQPAKVQRQTQVVSTLVDVDAPLDASGYIREDAYAVVVGISGYRSQSLPKVTYAKKDAEAVKDYLVGVCGFKEANIRLLVDDGASLSDLTAYCEEWLARNVRKGSFVFVYFAGHGTPSPDKGEAYIVPYDGEPGFVSKLYPLSRLYSSLAALPTDQVVVALDACFSGAGGRSVMEQGKRPLVAVDLEKEAQKLGNVAVLTASAGNEISQDYDAKRHGLFTYYLLKGLRGEADSDHDGWVTLGELHNYAKPKVADESQRLGYTQTLQLLSMGAATTARLAKLE
jgi:cyclophilin family peptidyl-prolyl cis-trans isomerase